MSSFRSGQPGPKLLCVGLKEIGRTVTATMPLKPRSPVLGLHPFLRYFSGSPSLTSPAPRKFRPLCGRYTEELPIELFRMNNGRNINVRDYKAQMQKQRTSYDLHVQPDGLVHPYTGDFFRKT